jgi:hypothetical protein
MITQTKKIQVLEGFQQLLHQKAEDAADVPNVIYPQGLRWNSCAEWQGGKVS